VASKSKTGGYTIRLVKEVEEYDLPELPDFLKEDLDYIYTKALEHSPYDPPYGIKAHKLSRILRNHRAIEIGLGSGDSYRLVYRIRDKQAPRTVWIYSFAEHDRAYWRAEERVRSKQKKRRANKKK